MTVALSGLFFYLIIIFFLDDTLSVSFKGERNISCKYILEKKCLTSHLF